MSEADEVLVLRSQAQDRAAFEELVRRTARLVFARICLDTGRAQGAEDLVQETYLLAWRSIGQLTDPAQFRSWLTSVARSVVVDAARREQRKKRTGPRAPGDPGDVLATLPSATPPPERIVEREESRRRVLDLLRALPEEYRLPLTLRYLGGADYETIGQQLGLTNGSLRGLLNRGMAMLRKDAARAGLECT